MFCKSPSYNRVKILRIIANFNSALLRRLRAIILSFLLEPRVLCRLSFLYYLSFWSLFRLFDCLVNVIRRSATECPAFASSGTLCYIKFLLTLFIIITFSVLTSHALSLERVIFIILLFFPLFVPMAIRSFQHHNGPFIVYRGVLRGLVQVFKIVCNVFLGFVVI